MATATLPTYVNLLYQDYSFSRDSALIRTEMESGPPKQARIKNKTMNTHNVKLHFDSKGDFTLFQTWFSTTLKEGSEWFNMTDPISGSSIVARFNGGGYTAKPMSAKMDNWEISAKIETWS